MFQPIAMFLHLQVVRRIRQGTAPELSIYRHITLRHLPSLAHLRACNEALHGSYVARVFLLGHRGTTSLPVCYAPDAEKGPVASRMSPGPAGGTGLMASKGSQDVVRAYVACSLVAKRTAHGLVYECRGNQGSTYREKLHMGPLVGQR